MEALQVPMIIIFFVAVFASILLWILDWIQLTRTWQTRDLLQNLAYVAFLLIGNFFAAYFTYFLLRPNLKIDTCTAIPSN